MAQQPDGWITAEEAATIKGVSRHAIYDAVKTGKIIGRQFAGRWMILRSSLEGYTPHGHRPRKRPSG